MVEPRRDRIARPSRDVGDPRVVRSGTLGRDGRPTGVSKIDDIRRQREARHQAPAPATKASTKGQKVVPIRALVENDNAERAEAPAPTSAEPASADVAVERAPSERPKRSARPSRALRGGGAKKPQQPARGARAHDETGTCSACGKVRALVNGLVAQHQKGLGKLCPGSRKAPA
jgi:hypothetical protein